MRHPAHTYTTYRKRSRFGTLEIDHWLSAGSPKRVKGQSADANGNFRLYDLNLRHRVERSACDSVPQRNARANAAEFDEDEEIRYICLCNLETEVSLYKLNQISIGGQTGRIAKARRLVIERTIQYVGRTPILEQYHHVGVKISGRSRPRRHKFVLVVSAVFEVLNSLVARQAFASSFADQIAELVCL